MTEKLLWDLLPEEFPYEDKGCELFPSCLNCPFPDCLKEEPWGKERFLKSRRAERMRELKREGKSVKEIARIFEVSPRTVQRWLKAVEVASPSVIASEAKQSQGIATSPRFIGAPRNDATLSLRGTPVPKQSRSGQPKGGVRDD